MDKDRSRSNSPLLRLLSSPGQARSLSIGQWEDLLSHARATRLGGRLWFILDRCRELDGVPAAVRQRLEAAFLAGEYDRRRLLWEIDRVQRALRSEHASCILLKGGAYALCGFNIARGRPSADLDIMVPFGVLAEVEAALLASGWEHVIVDDYDQRYYRRWMHELPPLRHRVRETELDLHHAILPRSSRLRLDMAPILAAAVEVDGRGVKVLAPADMTLHCAVHLFQDGEISGALRDLVDFDALLRQFAEDPGFWSALVPRATRLGLGRPLFYALRYAARLLETPIPADVLRAAQSAKPALPALALMDLMVPRTLLPAMSRGEKIAAGIARYCLYLRSHWLRMPFLPLVAHLARKSLRRWKLRASESEI